MDKKLDLSKATEKQKEKILQVLKEYSDRKKTDTNMSIISIGDFLKPTFYAVNQGDLGIAFVDRQGELCWINAIGEHLLLQFLIDKQYSKNIVRNSKEIAAGRDA